MSFLASATAAGDIKKMSNSRSKSTIHEFEQQVKEIRSQLGEQLRCLESRTETQVAILSELNDYYRRRAELDSEYGRQLEKLARNTMQKHKTEKNKRECWPVHSTCALWQQLIDETKEEARERSALAEFYSSHLNAIISQRADDLHRISRKCREVGILAHGEISRVLNELHTAMKTYQLCYAECAAVEAKFRQTEESKLKYEEENPTKLGATRKHRALSKLFEKRLEKYDIVKVKRLKARNEYLLCIGAANAALHKYFADDLSDLIDCMDLGMEQWQRGLISCTLSARKSICQKEMDALAELCEFKQALDARADKQKFFEANHATFMLPRRFEFREQIGDGVKVVSASKGVAEELQQRHIQIERRLANVRLESEEIWKTLESTEKSVAEKHAEILNSTGPVVQGSSRKENTSEVTADATKNRHDLNELYDYYLGKFSHYLLNSNLIERLEARANGIARALIDFSSTATSDKQANRNSAATTPSTPTWASEDGESGSCVLTRRKKRIGSGANAVDESRRPRLFGGSLDEYVEATGEPIPLLVTSTIRVLSQYALHHQGIFRISGSQVEISAFKEAFERGEDPLRDVVDASDANSVAGVLKLYLRELREPLFPIFLFDQLTECAKCSTSDEFIKKIVPLLETLSQPTLLVLRYLFAFLNHLSEFSDENMMDPYNLAICFGPTLLPIPEGKDQVFYHNFVNELVKNLIVYHEQVFPSSLPPPRYEKYLVDTDQALFIDEQDGIVSGDEEAASALPSDVPGERSLLTESAAQCYSLSSSKIASVEVQTPLTTLSKATPAVLTGCPTTAPFQSETKVSPPTCAEVTHTFQPAFPRRAPSLCSTGSVHSGGYTESASLTRHYDSFEAPSIDVVELVPNSTAVASSAQIWTRRAAAATSLREQLHHTRSNAHQDRGGEPQREESVVNVNRGKNQRLSQRTVSPLSSSSDVLAWSSGEDSPSVEGVFSRVKETRTQRDWCTPVNSVQSQVRKELKQRVLGEECLNVEPDLVRSLPHDASPASQSENTSPAWAVDCVVSPSSVQ